MKKLTFRDLFNFFLLTLFLYLNIMCFSIIENTMNTPKIPEKYQTLSNKQHKININPFESETGAYPFRCNRGKRSESDKNIFSCF